MKSLPRGLRNNNPGNIRITKDKWQGLREKQTGQGVFSVCRDEMGLSCLDPHIAELQKETQLYLYRGLYYKMGPTDREQYRGLHQTGMSGYASTFSICSGY